MLKDLKHSLRMFAQSPAFTLAAVSALTLGIGVNTAIFSVVNTVLLRSIPFPNPDRLVLFMNTSPQGSGPSASPAKFQHWRRQDSVVEDVAAFRFGVVNFTGGTFPEQLRSAQVSADFFKLFGGQTVLGRTFSEEEDLPKAPRVVVLSHMTWERRFDKDPQILGRTISLSGDPHVVIGVVGPDFNVDEFGDAPEVFVAFQIAPNTAEQGHYFRSAGRLKPGITLEQAQARLKLSADEFRARFPDALDPQSSFTVQPLQQALVRNVRSSLMVLAGAVSFVLLIACANVANLLLVRAAGRKREIAIRTAIGGSRGRIIRQMLGESVMLSLVGGALGLILGVIGIRALLSINTAGLPRIGEDGGLVGRRLARAWLHAAGVGGDRNSFRPHSSTAGLACRPQLHAQGNQRTNRHRFPAEQGTVSARGRRGRSGVDPAGRLSAADSHRRGTGARRAGLRRSRMC